jgi:hypothetical protein
MSTQTQSLTAEEKKQLAERALAIIKDAIVEAAQAGRTNGLGFVPNGHVYAALMRYVSFDTYTQLLFLLQREGRIRYTSERIYAV